MKTIAVRLTAPEAAGWFNGQSAKTISRSYQYSAIGNMTVNGDWAGGTYTYGSSRPHAATAANCRALGSHLQN